MKKEDQFLKADIEHLSKRFSALLNSKTGRSRKFTLEFKQEVLTHLQNSGMRQKEFCEVLGLEQSLLSNWKRKLLKADSLNESHSFTQAKAPIKSARLFQEIQIQDAPKQNASIYLEARSGVKVHGMTLSQIAEVLRCL